MVSNPDFSKLDTSLKKFGTKHLLMTYFTIFWQNRNKCTPSGFLRWDWNKKRHLQNTETLPFGTGIWFWAHTPPVVSQPEAVTNPAVLSIQKVMAKLPEGCTNDSSLFTQSKPPRPHHFLWLYTFQVKNHPSSSYILHLASFFSVAYSKVSVTGHGPAPIHFLPKFILYYKYFIDRL